MNFQPGIAYIRPCAVVQTDDGREYTIPVFDHVHTDPQFGFPYEHYHIDGRFEMEPRMRHEYSLENGCTNAVIKTHGGSPVFLRLEQRAVKFVQPQTGLSFPSKPTGRQQEKLRKYKRWYASYIGKSCAGKLCPHYGTEMIIRDGLLICPMHELTADPHTLRIIPRKL